MRPPLCNQFFSLCKESHSCMLLRVAYQVTDQIESRARKKSEKFTSGFQTEWSDMCERKCLRKSSRRGKRKEIECSSRHKWCEAMMRSPALSSSWGHEQKVCEMKLAGHTGSGSFWPWQQSGFEIIAPSPSGENRVEEKKEEIKYNVGITLLGKDIAVVVG